MSATKRCVDRVTSHVSFFGGPVYKECTNAPPFSAGIASLRNSWLGEDMEPLTAFERSLVARMPKEVTLSSFCKFEEWYLDAVAEDENAAELRKQVVHVWVNLNTKHRVNQSIA